jgi:hypothetical protein
MMFNQSWNQSLNWDSLNWDLNWSRIQNQTSRRRVYSNRRRRTMQWRNIVSRHHCVVVHRRRNMRRMAIRWDDCELVHNGSNLTNKTNNATNDSRDKVDFADSSRACGKWHTSSMLVLVVVFNYMFFVH